MKKKIIAMCTALMLTLNVVSVLAVEKTADANSTTITVQSVTDPINPPPK